VCLWFSPKLAVAYAESLAATESLRSAYGMRALRQMLDSLSEGESPETGPAPRDACEL